MIALEVNVTSGQAALARTLTKNAFPIVGARTLTHLQDSFKALELNISTDQIARLDRVSAVSMGYPQDLLKTVQQNY